MLSQPEYLEASGTGAYAAFTAQGVNTRRYHGLLVAGNGPDDSRKVLLSRCDEILKVGAESFPLGTRLFSKNTHPSGFQYLSNTQQQIFPELTYTIPTLTGSCIFKKSILAIRGEATVLVRYRLLSGIGVEMQLEPFCAFRNYHNLQSKNNAIFHHHFDKTTLIIRNEKENQKLYLSIPNSEFETLNQWHNDIYYPEDQQRGYEYLEDLFLPGILKTRLVPKQDLYLVISDQANRQHFGSKEWQLEVDRRQELINKSPLPKTYSKLVLAADRFLVEDENDSLNIIAGYPWFTCWARDSMISLPGLCLATGRKDDALKIINSWLPHISQGMLPNRLGVSSVPKYNSVDGTLWLILACYNYFLESNDKSFVSADLLKALDGIIDWHIAGTRYGIVMDKEDCLLSCGSENTQLTWMDANIDGKAVTPRFGKPVEINALWYNSLRILETWSKDATKVEKYGKLAKTCYQSFQNKFWLEAKGYFADCVNKAVVLDELRPNQLFAASLPFPLSEPNQALRMLSQVKEFLLTPKGLRTLSPNDPSYQGSYSGVLRELDKAYHQGTVWPWLLCPYVSAILHFNGEKGVTEAQEILAHFIQEIDENHASIVPEVYDGDLPQSPGGCFAQAWSLAALLEIASSLNKN